MSTTTKQRHWWQGLFRNLNAKIAAIPMIFATVVVFVGCSIWTVIYSFTKSKLLPVDIFQAGGFLGIFNSKAFVGFAQYERLLDGSRNSRWADSVENLFTYGIFSLTFSFTIGKSPTAMRTSCSTFCRVCSRSRRSSGALWRSISSTMNAS